MNKKLKELTKDVRFKNFIMESIEVLEESLENNQIDMEDDDIEYLESLIEFGKEIKKSLNIPIFSGKELLTFDVLKKLGVESLDDIEYINIDICKQIEFPLGVSGYSGIKLKNNDEFIPFYEADYEILENLNDVSAVWEEEVMVRDILPCFDKSLLNELLEKKVPFCFAYEVKEQDRLPLQQYLDDERKMCIGEDRDT